MLWNLDEFDWAMKESIDVAEGLLCIWDGLIFVRDVEFIREYIRISEDWGLEKKRCYFVNVYASNDRPKKLK